jgi:glycosyltransferase involved in cell wall biosynthesis
LGRLWTQGRMKLLFAIDSLATGSGGAERVLSEVASGLAERGHQIEIASFGPPGAPDFYPLHGEVIRHCLPSGLARRPLALRKLLLRRRPDVATGFMPSAYVPLALVSIGTGIPVIASEHTAWEHYRRHRLQALTLRLAAPLFAAFTTTSERVGAGFPPAMARRMVPIPNPVSARIGQSHAAVAGKMVLLSVGNLRKEKRHDTLIAAFSRIADAHPDWELRIVGEGAERARLEEQIRRLGLETRVRLTGTVQDVAAEYAFADLFAAASHYESFGIATAEALAAGLPAVGYADCPGINELIEDGVNGRLVSGSDRVSALASGLAELMDSAEKRQAMAAAGPPSVAQFSLSRVLDQWEELLRRTNR